MSLSKGRGVVLSGSAPGAQRRAGRVGTFLLEKMNKVERNGTSSPRGRKSGAKGRRWGWGREVRASAPGLLHSLRKFPLHFPFLPQDTCWGGGGQSGNSRYTGGLQPGSSPLHMGRVQRFRVTKVPYPPQKKPFAHSFLGAFTTSLPPPPLSYLTSFLYCVI